MVGLLMLMSLGQLQFNSAPLDDVVIGSVTPFSGQVDTNYVHGDVDGDGFDDLLVGEHFYPQKNGRYRNADRLPLPAPPCDVDADIWGGDVYFRVGNRLWIYTCEGGRWTLAMEDTLSGLDEPFGSRPGLDERPEISFRRFLYDLDEDDIPEVIVVNQKGAHVFRRDKNTFVPAGAFPLPASIVDNRSVSQSIWPPSQRKIVFPEQQLSCRIAFGAGTLRIVSIEERISNGNRYAVRDFNLTRNDDREFELVPRAPQRPAALPTHLRPCQLNPDSTLDFAGFRWVRSEASALPVHIFELWATLDGGESFHVQRAQAFAQFRPHCSFLDFDGDGAMDMVVESTVWPRGSVREQLSHLIGSKSIDIVVQVFRQIENRFAKAPTFDVTMSIDLDASLVESSPMRRRFESGRLIDMTGDMNGDGYRDLLVRNSEDEISVYLARDWSGFNRRVAWSESLEPDDECRVADLNQDGLADLYVSHEAPAQGESEHRGTAYYAREMGR